MAAMHKTAPEPPAPAREPVPPLRQGDRLTRAEFERRYEAMPGLKKAELIEGTVFMPSPVSIEKHSSPHAILVGWLVQYWAATPGVQVSVEGSVRLDPENMPQPDAFLMILPEHGGQARIDSDDYLEGAPELAVEVSASSVSYDLNEKRSVYCRCGVREYLVWRVPEGGLDWFVLREDHFERLEPDAAGIYRSERFPGLWLDAGALLRGDLRALFQALQAGLVSPEHAEFVIRLQQETAQP
jgi:Uma2 family endonuclease